MISSPESKFLYDRTNSALDMLFFSRPVYRTVRSNYQLRRTNYDRVRTNSALGHTDFSHTAGLSDGSVELSAATDEL
ncbi:hypothetical protein ACQKGI_08665 [Peribacillus muralis]|uniref:hypothetical protein n=1 Tax=Peribacillus muralis TaxID=264697 RepID=UPI0037F28D43